jgi:hypothetical protein
MPGSPSGALRGLRGDGSSAVGHGVEHPFVLNYELDFGLMSIRMVLRTLVFAIVGGLVLTEALPLQAQTVSAAAMDSLLGRLVGRWQMTGTVRGRPVTYTLDATRVLQGRFVELHMLDVARPPGYEARVFIGVDSAAARYIAHWLDRFGAGYSVPPATGQARGDTIALHFAYATGPFRDFLVYSRTADQWMFRLESADSTGAWRLFAEYAVRRR